MEITLATLSLALIIGGLVWFLVVGIVSGDLTSGGGKVLGPTPSPQDTNPIQDVIDRLWKLIKKAYSDLAKLHGGRYVPGAFLILAGIVLYVFGIIAGNTTIRIGGGPESSAPPTPSPGTSQSPGAS